MPAKTQPSKAEPKQYLQVFVIDSEGKLPILNGATAKRILRTKTKRVINFISLTEDTTLRPLTKIEGFKHRSVTFTGKHEIIRKISASDYRDFISKKVSFPALDKLLKAIPKEERKNIILAFRKSAA